MIRKGGRVPLRISTVYQRELSSHFSWKYLLSPKKAFDDNPNYHKINSILILLYVESSRCFHIFLIFILFILQNMISLFFRLVTYGRKIIHSNGAFFTRCSLIVFTLDDVGQNLFTFVIIFLKTLKCSFGHVECRLTNLRIIFRQNSEIFLLKCENYNFSKKTCPQKISPET